MNIQVEGRDGLTEAASRRVGTILNAKWRLDHLLGVGGTAAVYAATHRNGNRVAIKVLHTHFSLDEAIRGRLQQEGYVANLIEHPGAVRILDDDRTEDGSVFLVMELLAGEGLDARLKRKGWRLPRTEALGITYGLLDVLTVAHGKGVIHRDIKPDNVFVTREGVIKVLDFGIARILDLPQGMNRTRNGALFGTLGFMAPEQALGRTHEVDGRTDLWAVGATLFTLLSGRLVHEAPTPNEQLVNAATRVAPPLASVFPDVDPAVAALVDRALAFHQVDRWQSAAEMQDAVRSIILASPGPLGVPMLQGPRLSVEVDIDAIGEVRGRWASSSLRPSVIREPSRPTMIARRGRRSSQAVVVGAAVCTLLLVGALIRGARSMEDTPAKASAATGHSALAATQETPSVLLPTARAASGGVELVEDGVEPAELGGEGSDPRGEVAVIDPLRPHRRPLRRMAHGPGNTAMSSAAAPANLDNDALWGRRH